MRPGFASTAESSRKTGQGSSAEQVSPKASTSSGEHVNWTLGEACCVGSGLGASEGGGGCSCAHPTSAQANIVQANIVRENTAAIRFTDDVRLDDVRLRARR